MRSRLSLNGGSWIRLCPERCSPVGSWGFVFEGADVRSRLELRVGIDETMFQRSAMHVVRCTRARGAIDVVTDLIETYATREHMGSDEAREGLSRWLLKWLARLGRRAVYIRPGIPGEHAYRESFNGKGRDEPLSGEIA